MTRVYVGVGSNIDPLPNIRRGLALLGEQFGDLAVSTSWKTEPIGMVEGTPPFINLVVGLDTDDSVEQTRIHLDNVERLCGREKSGGNCQQVLARTLDLDLLLYGDLVRHDALIDVPRIDITEYAFVFEPLLELAPDIVHPETGARLAGLRGRLDLKGADMEAVELRA